MLSKLTYLLPLFAVAASLSLHPAQAQQGPDVIINEIYNRADQAEEYTEILVVKDDLDLRNYYFGDNNAATDSWQPKLQFAGVNFWQHLRAGTYIVIEHAPAAASCSVRFSDTDPQDGHIRVCSKDPRYFSGGGATTLNIASAGDFLQVVNDSTRQMVHGLGFDPNPGGSVEGGTCVPSSNRWTNTSSPQSNARPCANFIFLRQSLGDDRSVGLIGGQISAFSNTTSGIFVNDSTESVIGFFNGSAGFGNSLANSTWIRSLRRPRWQTQQLCLGGPTIGGDPVITWQPLVDPYPQDLTAGYIIVSSGTGQFGNPQDGLLYQPGQQLPGGGTVLATLQGAGSTTYTDRNARQGLRYRVFAFRYVQTSGISTPDRGPAYDTTNTATAAPGQSGLSVSVPAFVCPGDTFSVNIIGAGGRQLTATVGPGLSIVPTTDSTIVRVRVSPNAVPDRSQVQAAYTTAGACDGPPATAQVSIVASPKLVYRDSTITTGQTITLRPSTGTTTGLRYDLVDTAAGSITLAPRADTTFIVGARLAGSTGCRVSDSVRVRVQAPPIPPLPLLVPNIITPGGGDTFNEAFVIQGARVERLQIYNRWGKQVLNETPYTTQWQGPAGTYYFIAELTLPDGKSRTEKGWVEVVR